MSISRENLSSPILLMSLTKKLIELTSNNKFKSLNRSTSWVMHLQYKFIFFLNLFNINSSDQKLTKSECMEIT
jgi:hypothetical protein